MSVVITAPDGLMSAPSSWRLRPGASAWPEVNGFLFFADGLAGLLIGACLLMTALGLSLQPSNGISRPGSGSWPPWSAGRSWKPGKGGCPPPSRVVLEGRSYEVVSQQTERDGGLILRYVEAGDDHGLRVPAGSWRRKRLEKNGWILLDVLLALSCPP